MLSSPDSMSQALDTPSPNGLDSDSESDSGQLIPLPNPTPNPQSLEEYFSGDSMPPNLWIVGTPKQRAFALQAYTASPTTYEKKCNRWWDGYQDEETVFIDNFGKNNAHLLSYLKMWFDQLPFIANVHNDMKLIRPKRFIIFSKYPPEQIWPQAIHLQQILHLLFTVYLGNPIKTNC